jgi:hypothetical protein
VLKVNAVEAAHRSFEDGMVGPGPVSGGLDTELDYLTNACILVVENVRKFDQLRQIVILAFDGILMDKSR